MSTGHRTVIETDYPLAEVLDRCVELAEKLGDGSNDWTDAPTLLAHLRVLRDDLELTEQPA